MIYRNLQNVIAGPEIRNADHDKDLKWGPKTNLPPKKNL